MICYVPQKPHLDTAQLYRLLNRRVEPVERVWCIDHVKAQTYTHTHTHKLHVRTLQTGAIKNSTSLPKVLLWTSCSTCHMLGREWNCSLTSRLFPLPASYTVSQTNIQPNTMLLSWWLNWQPVSINDIWWDPFCFFVSLSNRVSISDRNRQQHAMHIQFWIIYAPGLFDTEKAVGWQ